MTEEKSMFDQPKPWQMRVSQVQENARAIPTKPTA